MNQARGLGQEVFMSLIITILLISIIQWLFKGLTGSSLFTGDQIAGFLIAGASSPLIARGIRRFTPLSKEESNMKSNVPTAALIPQQSLLIQDTKPGFSVNVEWSKQKGSSDLKESVKEVSLPVNEEREDEREETSSIKKSDDSKKENIEESLEKKSEAEKRDRESKDLKIEHKISRPSGSYKERTNITEESKTYGKDTEKEKEAKNDTVVEKPEKGDTDNEAEQVTMEAENIDLSLLTEEELEMLMQLKKELTRLKSRLLRSLAGEAEM